MTSRPAKRSGSQSEVPFRKVISQCIPTCYRCAAAIRQILAAGPARLQPFRFPALRALGGGTRRQTRPAGYRVGGANDVHSGGRVALEGGVRLIRVVDNAGHDDRRRAVLEQVRALGEPVPYLLVLQ